MRPPLLLLLVAAACALGGTDAQAQFPPGYIRVVPLAYDTLGTSPATYRFTYGLQNPQDPSNGLCADFMRVDPSPAGQVLSWSGPAGWTRHPDGWIWPTTDFCPGQDASPFEIVTDSPSGCFLFAYDTPIMVYRFYTYCIDGRVVPTQPLSWGRVKAIYR